MTYKVVNNGGQIPQGITFVTESPGEALTKVRAGRRLFGSAVVLDDDDNEVRDAELERRMAAEEPR